MRTALYRHFDAAGALLYVGISLNSIQRTAQHRSGAKWYQEIANITIEWLPTRSAALTAEAIAIAKESPRWNVQRAQPMPTPVDQPTKRCYGVLHFPSGRIDGWYARRTAAEQMLGWFCAVFPQDKFKLIDVSSFNASPIGDLHLKTCGGTPWAATEPDYAAGDEYDKRFA